MAVTATIVTPPDLRGARHDSFNARAMIETHFRTRHDRFSRATNANHSEARSRWLSALAVEPPEIPNYPNRVLHKHPPPRIARFKNPEL